MGKVRVFDRTLHLDHELVLKVTVEELFIARQADEATTILLRVIFRIRSLLAETRAAVHSATELAVLHFGLKLIAAGACCGPIWAVACLQKLFVYLLI